MGGPMPSLASGYRSWTDWASTWAAEWRSTYRPSWLDSATGSILMSASGAQLRSRSAPSGPLATTIAFGPVIGSLAAATASAQVVPAGTKMGSATGTGRRDGGMALSLAGGGAGGSTVPAPAGI